MAVKVLQNSYLRFSDFYSSNGYSFWDVPDWPIFKPQNEDKFITVISAYVNRPDLIAWDQYGDSELFWVICLANGIDTPPTGFYLNREIRIPSLTYVRQVLKNVRK